MVINRWDILLVNLDPTIGKEIKKIRPAVVVSPQEVNHHWNPITVIPLTSKIRELGFRTKVNFEGKAGQVAIDQIKAVDKQRLIKKLGTLNTWDAEKVQQDLLIYFQA